MKIFVTGATGFIGSNFVKIALESDCDLVALKRPGSECRIKLDRAPKWIEGDLEVYPKSALSGCDTLVHFAAYGVDPSKGRDWDSCFFWNVEASARLWKTAIESGVRRLIICGSCFEYGKSGERTDFISTDTPLLPQTPYAASKAAATMLAIAMAALYNVELDVVRPFQVFGEGEAEHRLWPSLKNAALAGDDFPMTPGGQIRDFTPVESIASDTLNLLKQEIVPKRVSIKNKMSIKIRG